MRILVICQGLPASGKSTWARSMCPPASLTTPVRPIVVVNKDTIRSEFAQSGWVWSQASEGDVIVERDRRITEAFANGAEEVISDDTNFGRHPKVLKQLAERLGVHFRIQSFLHVPVEECVKRDAHRSPKVGPKVIYQMAHRYGIPYTRVFAPVGEDDPSLADAIICDLDGTLAWYNGRDPFDASTCQDDLVNPVVLGVLNTYASLRMHQAAWSPRIIYVSGRSAKFYKPTSQWLLSVVAPDSENLYMRPDGDQRPDWEIKGELFDEYIRGRYNVLFVLDDRTRVVDFWRSIGLTCFQVAPGDF